ncbi:MAG: AMP-binding protein [Anaerolineae bacterium]|nr:AMP-binding protein [Anaerolineae bacterium]MBN8617782.1 AMP-binding protein [Anaerolineae bacterium]
MSYTAHVDTFARDNLPPRDQWPEMIFEIPEVQYPERINCGAELLDKHVQKGWGNRPVIHNYTGVISYAEMLKQVNQIAQVLTEDMGLVPGNRVLLRGANSAIMAICWFAVVKAGLIAVTTMAMLREKELVDVMEKAQVNAALCDKALDTELLAAQKRCPSLKQIMYFNDASSDGLEARAGGKSGEFEAIDTAADDVVLIAFTSGTTGKPKGTMHFHRDVLTICDCFPKSIVQMTPDDISIGTPPLAFTFGLGGILLFPMRVGGSTVLLEKLSPDIMLKAIQDFKITITWSSPVFYRQMSGLVGGYNISSLKKCISAGEALPVSTRTMWREASGIEMIDGIGSTELLHIFISAAGADVRPGSTGRPIPGYRACILDQQGNPLPSGNVGRLAVKGPTGCRYMSDERQKDYSQNGWNVTGDAYFMDDDGYFWFHARTDDIILTAGYNVSGPEVEEALMKHPAVADCAVVGAPDDDRGQIVKAFVVLKAGETGDEAMVKTLQEFVKQVIAPYKYPRAIEFKESLPRTNTGKLQRFVLRRQEMIKAQ